MYWKEILEWVLSILSDGFFAHADPAFDIFGFDPIAPMNGDPVPGGPGPGGG